jgi:hypothetical protein
MANLYADEDFSHRAVVELRSLGHDVLTIQEAGQGSQGVTDIQVLAYAIALGRAVLTHNRRHFIRLHTTSRPHRGIVVCTRDDADPIALAGRIHQALAGCTTLDDQLVRVNRPP